MMARVRFAARDPGGANVLAAFLSRYQSDAPFSFDVWSLPEATPVFRHSGLSPQEFPRESAGDVIYAMWQSRPADVLITGTSHYAPFESLLWGIARKHDCPSLAVMDSWVNLDRRFLLGRPDYVGAVDHGQIDELKALGFRANRIITTGHPWLSKLLQEKGTIPETTAVPSGNEDVRLLFVSEPIAKDVAEGVNASFGFDEFDAFVMLYRAAVAAAKSGLKVGLGIKFHPCEDPQAFLRRLSSLDLPHGLKIHEIKGGERPHPWILWSDLIAGIGSMLLLEAIVLGKPVISLQPGLRRENTFIAGRRGFSPTLTVPGAGETILSRLLNNPEERSAMVVRQQGFIKTIPTDTVSPIMTWIRQVLPQ
jgi:hypothetical protein